jgi:hypothetical protein
MTEIDHITLFKICKGCGEQKPWSEFSIDKKVVSQDQNVKSVARPRPENVGGKPPSVSKRFKETIGRRIPN